MVKVYELPTLPEDGKDGKKEELHRNGSFRYMTEETLQAVENSEKKVDNQEKKSVSIPTLFRFADRLDKLLMLIGCIAGLVTGSMLPVSMILFGGITDVFVDDAYRQAVIENITQALNLTGNWTEMINSTTVENILDWLDAHNKSDMADMIRDLMSDDFMSTMQEYAIKYTVIGIIMLVTAYVEVVCWATTSHRQTKRIRLMLLWSVLRQDIGWFDTYEPSELNTRLADDVDKIQEGTGDKLALLFQYVSVAIAGIIVGFIYGWKMTLVMLAASPFMIIAGAIMGFVGSVLSTKELKAYAKAGAVAQEVFSCIRTVTAFSGQTKEYDRYSTHLQEAHKFGVKKGYINGIAVGFVFLSLFWVEAFALWYGAQLVFAGEMSAGDMLIVFFSIIFAAFSIGMAGPNMQSLAMAQGAAYEIFKTIDLEPKIDGTSDKGIKPTGLTGTVEFNGVIFRYPSRANVPVLQGFDLTVNVGQTIALVGNSGCGKSTVVQLLQRFYDPQSGDILIDGRNIKDYNVQWLRQHIGVVSQEPVLFATTIAENISYGRDGVTQPEIETAAKEANAHDFIVSLPKGYQTLVGERGAQLSGGQKQRIAIARALVRSPKILLLDEATSALDTENEAIVQATLDKARRGRTTFVVAHRLSTIRSADVIAGIKNGVIVEKGTHDELMALGGVYHQLVTQQTLAAKEEAEDDDDEEDAFADEKKVHENGINRLISQTSDGEVGMKRQRMLSVSSDGKASHVKLEEESQLGDPRLSRIVKLNSPEWLFIFWGSIGAIVFGCNQPAFAILFSDIIGVFGTIDEEQQNKELLIYCGIMLIVGLVTAVAMFLLTSMFTRSGETLTTRLRLLAFQAYLRQELSYFDDQRNSTGALCVRLSTDASAVQGATGSRLGTLLQSLSNIVFGLLIGFYFSWKLTLILLLFTPFVVLGGYVEMRMLTGRKLDDKIAFDEAGKVATECIINIRTVATLTKERKFWTDYSQLIEKPYRRELRNTHALAGAYAFSQAMYNWAYAAGFMAGAHLVNNGEVTYEDMFKVFSAVIFGAVAVGQAFSFAPDYSKAKIAASRLFALFDRQPTIDNCSTDGIVLSDCTGQTEFSKVRFSYPSRPDVPVLRGLNLHSQPGRRLALVGSSGCGKSTVVQLIERFYDPHTGTVALDGANTQDINIQWLRSQMSIVSQEPVLFDSTIRENIEYGDNSRTVSMDEVVAAAKMANIHTFITSLPKGYETDVGEKGSMLSGGQKQRVAIARALIRNPKLLLLDEATSALDTESEKIVQEALDKAQEGRTCIVIAHRLSTIQGADCIVVLRHGRIAEIGTHSELLAKKGIYYTLNNAQLAAAATSAAN